MNQKQPHQGNPEAARGSILNIQASTDNKRREHQNNNNNNNKQNRHKNKQGSADTSTGNRFVRSESTLVVLGIKNNNMKQIISWCFNTPLRHMC